MKYLEFILNKWLILEKLNVSKQYNFSGKIQVITVGVHISNTLSCDKHVRRTWSDSYSGTQIMSKVCGYVWWLGSAITLTNTNTCPFVSRRLLLFANLFHKTKCIHFISMYLNPIYIYVYQHENIPCNNFFQNLYLKLCRLRGCQTWPYSVFSNHGKRAVAEIFGKAERHFKQRKILVVVSLEDKNYVCMICICLRTIWPWIGKESEDMQCFKNNRTRPKISFCAMHQSRCHRENQTHMLEAKN